MGVEFRVLGPLEVLLNATAIPLPSGRARILLATLLLRANEVVPVDELVDRLWGGMPPNPSRAKATLHMVVTRLRQALGEANCVRTATGGYLAEVPPGALDLYRFRSLVEEGEFAEALGLWRGSPLSNVASDSLHRDVVSALSDERLEALERRIEVDLDAGEFAGLVTELRALTKLHPLRERFWAQLMLAQYRSDQQADALATYRSVNELLVGELGVDPGPKIQEAYRLILAANERSTSNEFAVGDDGTPRQLPASSSGFVGRTDELDHLSELVAAASHGGGAVVISAIHGTAGIGKTALAVHWAHRIADRFPDGQLYLNLRGFDPSGVPMSPSEAIHRFISAFGVAPERVPVDVDASSALYRSLLADRKVLVVLDNARDTDQVRPLLPGSSTCLVVITSRNRLVGLITQEGAHPVTLDVLREADSVALLTRKLGAERVAAEPGVVLELIGLCAGLPLALAVVAARAAINPSFPLRALADELSDVQRKLEFLDTGDPTTSVRSVFSWSYQRLNPAAARVFRLLGLHAGPDISAHAAASLAATSLAGARESLTELTKVHLLTEHVPGRFTFHDLLRAYAAYEAGAHDSAAERRAAVHRVLDHYLHTADRADQLLYPYRDPIPLGPALPGVGVEELGDHDQALGWCERERPTLLAAIAQAADHGFDEHAWRIPFALATFLQRRGYWNDQVATQHTALAAGHRSGSRVAQARAHRGLGQVLVMLERYDEATVHLGHALERLQELGDRTGLANTHRHFTEMYERQARNVEALDHAKQALELFSQLGHRAGLARALNAVGWCHSLNGEHHEALDNCLQALVLFREVGDTLGIAATWDSVGYARYHLGELAESVDSYEQALVSYRKAGERYEETATLGRLAAAHRSAGDLDRARAVLELALTILDDLGHPDADRIRAELRGMPASSENR